VTDLFID